MWLKQLDDLWLTIFNDNNERLADAYDLNSALKFIKNHSKKEQEQLKENKHNEIKS